jgi:S-adenosylmethionine hydrolase
VPEEVPVTAREAAGPAAPIVTLTTDFGLSDAFVGLVKAGVLGRAPDARIIDLTHAVPSYDLEAGAFWIERSCRFFPAGTVHLGVVDPGVGTERRILLVEHAGQLFLGPDNGLLGPIASREGAVVRVVTRGFLDRMGLTRASPTFHGRDLFAPLAGLLACGSCRAGDVGPVVDDWQRPPWPRPVETPDGALGRVIIIDRFGNCFSNIDAESLVHYQNPIGLAGGHELPLVRTYGERPDGSMVILANAFGVLEVACVGGDAARSLGLGVGDRVELRPARY